MGGTQNWLLPCFQDGELEQKQVAVKNAGMRQTPVQIPTPPHVLCNNSYNNNAYLVKIKLDGIICTKCFAQYYDLS